MLYTNHIVSSVFFKYVNVEHEGIEYQFDYNNFQLSSVDDENIKIKLIDLPVFLQEYEDREVEFKNNRKHQWKSI